MFTGLNWDQIKLLIKIFIFFLVFSTFLISQANWYGFEGDDMNSLIPMLNLNFALGGDLEIYRYDWQPLNYHLGSNVYNIFGSPSVILILHPLYITLALSLIIFQCARKFHTPVWLLIVFLFMMPELFYTALYYNSSAPAFLCAVSAFCLALEKPSTLKALFIGLLSASAIFLRMDFVLVLPFLFVFYIQKHKDMRTTIISTASFLAFAGVILTNQNINLSGILDSYLASSAEISEKSGSGGWNRYSKNMTTTTIFSPIGWVYFLIGGMAALKYLSKDNIKPALLLLLSFLPTLIVVPNLLSVKYMLPAFVVLPFLAAFLWCLLREKLKSYHFRCLNIGLMSMTIVHLVFSVEPETRTPYINITSTNARQIGTHDGPRSWGSYISQILKVKEFRRDQESFEHGLLLAEFLLNENADKTYYVGDQSFFSTGAAGWRYAFLMLEIEGVRGTVIDKGVVRFLVGKSELWLFDEFQKYEAVTGGAVNNCVFIADEGIPDCLALNPAHLME